MTSDFGLTQSIVPEKEMEQAWENMRVEILHELQEGAEADIPESDIDEIGKLVVELDS